MRKEVFLLYQCIPDNPDSHGWRNPVSIAEQKYPPESILFKGDEADLIEKAANFTAVPVRYEGGQQDWGVYPKGNMEAFRIPVTSYDTAYQELADGVEQQLKQLSEDNLPEGITIITR